MQIILLEDVKSVGKKGDIVKLSDGYARNFILPKKLGLEATPKNLNDLKLQKKAEEKQKQELLDEAKKMKEFLEANKVEVEMKVGEGGRTFGSISSKEIEGAIKKQLNVDIDKKKIQISDAIKSLGVYNVQIKLHPKVSAELKVHVAEKK
ncbi:MAG: 50S ribosomal protein L9 [Lachnospiraceae bacterium]|nr:50S ribosomal protein L9 [Lachnospiraceae bacterium]